MIFRSPYTDVSIPEVSVPGFVLRRALERGDKLALIDGASGNSISYAQLANGVRSVAAGLAARGFGRGDVFAIYSPNVPEYAIALYAVATLGGASTTINPLYTADEVAHQLKDAGASYLLTVPALMDKARAAAAKAGIREIFVLGETNEATPFASLMQSDGDAPEVHINAREDVFALPYSSGTTGLPKGVMLTHYNVVANLCQQEAINPIQETDTLICILPLFHIYGMAVILNMGLHRGATIVTMQRFDLERVLKAMQDYGVTYAHLVPPIILALTKQQMVDDYDLSKLHTIFSGAAPLGETITQACVERLGCQIRQGYGMTETSPVIHMSPGDPAQIKHGAVGQCIPNTECKIVCMETGAALGPNREGEICMRGPQMMKGYLNKPEATAATIDFEGWLHTGDIGYADEDGHFFIVDRAKELIKYKGFQVAPAELEAILLSHPSIADAAVIPVADEEAGEIPKAFIVLKSAATADDEEIKKFVAERVAPYKKIRRLERIEQIPKSAAGKILRRVLVERERERSKKNQMPAEQIQKAEQAHKAEQSRKAERAQKAIADYFAAIRAMDASAWVATFADDAISYDPVGAPPMAGHAALRQFFEGIAGAFEKVGLFEERVFVSGNEAAVKWTGRGTGKNG
ncbi:MAG TPA: AMP-binding protein, partial [Pyrinomonadaceae bacterium]